MRSSRARARSIRRPLCRSSNSTSGQAIASWRTATVTWPASVRTVLRNCRRAGTEWKRSCAFTTVPELPRKGRGSHPSHLLGQGVSSPPGREVMMTFAIAARLARASPRHSRVRLRKGRRGSQSCSSRGARTLRLPGPQARSGSHDSHGKFTYIRARMRARRR